MGICKNDWPRTAQCLYGCSSVAQLNESGKAHACGAATYSVIGTLLKARAPINTSSRREKWRFYVGFYGTCVPEMTSNTLPWSRQLRRHLEEEKFALPLEHAPRTLERVKATVTKHKRIGAHLTLQQSN
jgi:hypothetical protein